MSALQVACSSDPHVDSVLKTFLLPLKNHSDCFWNFKKNFFFKSTQKNEPLQKVYVIDTTNDQCAIQNLKRFIVIYTDI